MSKEYKDIIPPVPVEELEAELTNVEFVRNTNYGNNEVYIFSNNTAPKLMLEVGRLRELAFRNAGGGTGKKTDIDCFDTAESPYQQLIVWDPKAKIIAGGYRFMDCRNYSIKKKGNPILAINKLFEFSELFIKDYLPFSMALGRSFVNPVFQTSGSIKKSIYALDNLWDGLGALIVDYNIKHFFGKATIYPNYNPKARDLVLYFMQKYFPDPDKLIYPYKALPFNTPKEILKKCFTGKNYNENHKILSKKIRELNINIPPLINSYMSLSPSMRSFGTAINTQFGNVLDTGLLVTISDIYKVKIDRHVSTYSAHRKT